MSTTGRARVRLLNWWCGVLGEPRMITRLRKQRLCERVNRREHHAALSANRYCTICTAALR